MTRPLPQHPAESQRRRPARNMHRSAPREIQSPELIDPTIRIPSPTRQGVIDERRPDEHENNTRQYPAPLAHGADEKRDGQAGEHSLIDGIEEVGDIFQSDGGGCEDVAEAYGGEVADVAVCCLEAKARLAICV